MKTFIYILVLITGLAGLSSCEKKQEEKSQKTESAPGTQPHSEDESENSTSTSLTTEQVKTIGLQLGAIEPRDLSATIKANGTLRVPNKNKGNITALYGGVIKSMSIELGNTVRKGQVIATISNPQFIQLQEEYLTLGNRIVLAEQEMQRQKELSEGNAGAKKNFQAADAELNTLKTRKASIQAQLQLMGINPHNINNSNLQAEVAVTSPISGAISNIYSTIGSYVDVASPLAEVIDNSSLHLDLEVFEKDLPMIRIGQKISFTLTNHPGTQYEAAVFNIGSSFSNNSKTISVHCHVSGDKKGLIDGMNTTGFVNLSRVTTPAVLSEAIVNDNGKDYIFILSEKASTPHHHHEGEDHDHDHGDTSDSNLYFEKIEVVKGLSNGGYTAISPIREVVRDAKVVTKGAFFINAKMSDAGGHGHSH
jgi:cobalt-zinc-cadmium efflux system membrane fusion protein